MSVLSAYSVSRFMLDTVGAKKKLTVYGIWLREVYWKINKIYGLLDMCFILRNGNNFLKNDGCAYFSYFIDLDTQVKIFCVEI